MAIRAPHLYTSLRGFALGGFVLLGRDLEEGAELPIAFEEHRGRRGPALYEYRPLVRPFVEEREARLRALPDVTLALEELRREPAAAIFARAHAGPRPDEDLALFLCSADVRRSCGCRDSASPCDFGRSRRGARCRDLGRATVRVGAAHIGTSNIFTSRENL